MIPVCLVTGFLGSGKTTLLKRIAERYPGRRLVFLVNEFSAADVDGGLLRETVDNVWAIPGGSIFCTCLVSEFIRVLRALPEQFSLPDAPVDGVVIEASGIANPKVVERMLHETGLDATYALASIVAIADPGTFPILVKTLPNIVAQIESCDWVLLNKTDLHPEETVTAVERDILEIHPGVPILRCRLCDADIPLFVPKTARGLTGEYAQCADPHYAVFHAHAERKTELDALLTRLHGLPGRYRVKGFVRTRDGAYYVDGTASSVTALPAAAHAGPFELAIIVGREHAAAAKEFVAYLEQGTD